MGWTFSHRDKGVTHEKWFSDQWRWDDAKMKSRLLACAGIGFDVVYLAIEWTHKEDLRREVFAVVSLIQWRRNDWWNFGNKDISEHEGPMRCECPEWMLNMLTETDNKYALEWRAACRERIKKQKARPSFSKGSIVKLRDPVTFTRGGTGQVFIVENGRRLYVQTLTGRRVRLNKWAIRGFEVLKPEGTAVDEYGSLSVVFDNGDHEPVDSRLLAEMCKKWWPKGIIPLGTGPN